MAHFKIFAATLAVAATLSFAVPASAASCVITHSLGLGSRGAEVSCLQTLLTQTGDYTYGQITGYFGPTTQAALQHFQYRLNVVTSGGPATTGYGSVGPRTRGALASGGNIVPSAPGGGTSPSVPAASNTNNSPASPSSNTPAGTTTPSSNSTLSSLPPSSNETCSFNGQSVASGASVTAYQAGSVAYGSTCVSETRTCINGTLSGSYAYNSCAVLAAVPVDVFLIAGQSNAQGAGNNTLSPSVSSKVLQYYGGQVTSGADPVGNASTGSAWPAFGNAYVAATGHIVMFVPTARGGTCQSSACSAGASSHPDNWDTGGSLFAASVQTLNGALQALRAQGYDPTFKGILWSQGEADAVVIQTGGETYQQYRDALARMIARYRAQLGTVPFFIFRTGAVPGGQDLAVRAAQEQIASADPLTYMVFRGSLAFGSQGLLQSDGLHYTQAGYNLMGQIGAQRVAALQDDGTDADTPVLGLAANGDYDGVSIRSGGSYTLSWATVYFASCALNYNSSIGQGSGSISIAGSASGSSSTGLVGTYTLSCTTSAGQNLSSTVTIIQQ